MSNARVVHGMPNEEYHAVPALSSSFVKKFSVSPAASQIPMEGSPSMVIGSGAHSLILEGADAFIKDFAVSPKFDLRTNAGKAEKAKFELEHLGKSCLNEDQFQLVKGMDESVSKHPCSSLLFRNGHPEVSVFWTDDATGQECKARFDYLTKGMIVDLKTTSAGPSSSGFEREIAKYSYHIQAAFYLRAAEEAGLDVSSFVFVAVCNSEPHEVTVGEIEIDALSAAHTECNRLMGLIKECKERNTWPAFQLPKHVYSLDEVTAGSLFVQFSLPKWAV
jgi:PDDEXK-like domain of unknown function (DUF3799)